MSKTRSVSSLAAGLGILALACWLVTATFPLAAAPQMVADGPGVTVDTGGAVMHRGSIVYPESARARHIQGVVIVEATVDGSGNVVDTRVLSGPMELRRAAQQSVLNWHFAMDSSMNTRQVKVNFDLSAVPDPAAVPSAATRVEVTQPAPAPVSGLAAHARTAPPSAEGKRLARIVTGGLPDSARSDVLSRLPVHEGDTLSADSLERARKAVREFDEHMNLGTGVMANGDVVLNISVPGASISSGATGAFAGVPPPADGTKRITIGGNVQQSKLVSQARPVYPPLAKQARIQGVVHLSAIIGKDGTVINLAVIDGHPLLIPSALDAVRQWVYQTTLLNGDPVEVITQIDVNYTLSDGPPLPPQQ